MRSSVGAAEGCDLLKRESAYSLLNSPKQSAP
ncbi:hypothetical protein EMIT0P260_20512 [Pseudomonas sp. IT-P260]